MGVAETPHSLRASGHATHTATYRPLFRFFRAAFFASAPFELAVVDFFGGAAGVPPPPLPPLVPPARFTFGFGINFRSAMPQRLDAMKYRHKPLATLKNKKPMNNVMYFIIFSCIADCSSVAGGVKSCWWTRNRPTVINGSTFKYGPSIPVSETNMLGMKLFQNST